MSILSTVIGVLPFVGSIVQGVEALFGHGNGATKKAAAISTVQAGLGAYSTVTGVNTSNSTLLSDLGNLIDAVVAVYNDLGIFTHEAAASGGAAPAAAGK